MKLSTYLAAISLVLASAYGNILYAYALPFSDHVPTKQLDCGNTRLSAVWNGQEFDFLFSFKEKMVCPYLNAPVVIEVDGEYISSKYGSVEVENGALRCIATVTSPHGSVFAVTDIYRPAADGAFSLIRKVQVDKESELDNHFNTFWGFETGDTSHFTNYEFFIPSVWYKNNFTPEGNIPPNIPQAGDSCFLYRSDRITLPMVMFRNPADNFTISIVHKDNQARSVMADSQGQLVNAGYQFGAVGAKKHNGKLATLFAYPGTEENRRAGSGRRSHPVRKNVKHEYTLEVRLFHSEGYSEALRDSWERAFDIYNPPILKTDLPKVYEGLIKTLKKVYVPSVRSGGEYDEAGFPFEVSLKTFQPQGIDYQIGFVGMQVATGYYLYRDGIEKGDSTLAAQGEDVLDFWARRSQTPLGLPRAWYDPAKGGQKGKFRPYNTLRTVAGGMESLTAAWRFAKAKGIDHPDWIAACQSFGNWLVANQNDDGSWYFSYDHTKIVNGRHPATNHNKYLTVCAIRYLVELHEATGIMTYKDAALRAGNFCYENIHEKYAYVACVVDNPQTIDSESGQIAMDAFLALYRLTDDRKWLLAAEQAGTYAETWTFMYNIPVEDDNNARLVIPRNTNIVGQHLIAIGHAAADLGFAWNTFNYYTLYRETGKGHYLHVARISAHNTKQTMNWDGKLYPGQLPGLQLEAFRIMIPRRVKGVLTTLNWNYAAHLAPMLQFKDAFGTPDLEEVIRLSQ